MADSPEKSAKVTEAFDAVTRWCEDYFLSATGSGTPLGPQFVRVLRTFREIAAATASSGDANRSLRLSMLREKVEAYLQVVTSPESRRRRCPNRANSCRPRRWCMCKIEVIRRGDHSSQSAVRPALVAASKVFRCE